MNIFRRTSSFFRQHDVRAKPVRAILRRARWRAHWALRPNDPFELRTWTHGLTISLPDTGAAAQVYYRQFSSTSLARLLSLALTPGMHFLDVGAHVGEYSLLAGHLVGPSGRVDAIEPQAGLARVIESNARRNGLMNVVVHQVAVSDREERRALEVDPSSGGSWLSRARSSGGAPVESMSLDSLLEKMGSDRVDIAKVDAAGNEADVFRGAERALSGSNLPLLIYKLYGSQVVADRYGRDSLDAMRMLQEYGYQQWIVQKTLRKITTPAAVHGLLPADYYSIPIFACKVESLAESILEHYASTL